MAYLEDTRGVKVDPVTDTQQDAAQSVLDKFEFDRVDGQVTIDIIHHKIHEGDFYSTGYVNSDVDSATVEMLFEVGDKECHLSGNIEVSAGSRLKWYENSTKTTGTPTGEINQNRISNKTATLTASHAPAGAGDGDLLLDRIFGTTGASPSSRTPGSTRAENEWVLKPNTKYLLTVTTLQNDTSVSFSITWYELEE